MGFGELKPVVAGRRVRKRMNKTVVMEARTGFFRQIGVALGKIPLYRIK